MKDYSDFEIISGGSEMLDRIKPMWEELREFHASQAHHFAHQMRSTSFDQRRIRFNRFSKAGDLLVEVVWHGPTNEDVAYSVSSIESEDGLIMGRLESLFVSPDFRIRAIGTLLAKRSLDWMKSRKCDRITLSIAEGNETAFAFYRHFGFEVRYSVMELKTGK